MSAVGNAHGVSSPHAGANVKKKDLDNAQVGGAYMAHVPSGSVFSDSKVNLTEKQKGVSVFS